MAAILRNDDAEALILDIRTARTAGMQVIPAGYGAFLTFATSVVLSGALSGHLVFPLHCAAEPGTLVAGEGSAEVTGTVAGVAVTGVFHWTVGEGPPRPEVYRFRRCGRDVPPPTWAGQLPGSQLLLPQSPAALARRQARLRRQGRHAEHWLLRLTERLLQQTCRGSLTRGVLYRPPIDTDDLVQRGLQTAGRLLPVYASKDRPPCSWLGMVRLDARRDVRRELTRLDWLPVDAVAALTLADACGIDLSQDPAGVWDDLIATAERLRQSVPRMDAVQFESVMRASRLAAHEGHAVRAAPGPEVEGEPGLVAATVACLVSTDVKLIARAAAGDPDVLSRVGGQVRRRLNGQRDELWDHFVASGQLFATPAGVAQFRLVDIETLAAIDERLHRAARLRSVAG
jgi:hypothetical protein